MAELMRRAGVRAADGSWPGQPPRPPSPRTRWIGGSSPGEPDRVWAGDITYIATGEGWLYLAAVLDLGSRRVVGWATADHLRAELVERALGDALERRRPAGPLLHHSDRGVQYACDDYQELLRGNGLDVEHEPRGGLL